MITEEKHAYRMLFFRQNGITPIAEVSRAAEFLFPEGILGVIRMRWAAPAWQHGGMAWRAAGDYSTVTYGSLPLAPMVDGIMLLFLTFLFCPERRRTEGPPA
jgi:hypothetical protein